MLQKLEGYSKTLVNVYLPKEDSTTTEVDMIFIHQTGIYVIESKNYGGWIFGNENSRFWMQTFKTGKKDRFYNPIWQNNTHIKYLKKQLPQIEDNIIKSLIVFSERCSIKEMHTSSDNVYVIKTMQNILDVSKQVISPDEIINIYNKLKPYTNVSEDVKMKHIENIGVRG